MLTKSLTERYPLSQTGKAHVEHEMTHRNAPLGTVTRKDDPRYWNGALDNRVEQMKHIKDKIMNTAKYRRTARPQATANETTFVSFELKAASVPSLSWKDQRVSWDPKNYGGVDNVFLNSTEIWTPSIIELSPLELSRPRDAMVSLTSTGEASWCPLYSISAICERRTSLHLFTVLLPTVAVVLLSLLVFWLPPESERKITLIGAALLTSLLLLYRVDNIVSRSSSVPKIVKVLGGGVLMNALIAATTVLSTNMARSAPSCALPVFLVKSSEFVAHRLPCPCPAGRSAIGDDEAGVQNKSYNNAVAREWYTAARALDRVLGLVFAAAYVALCL
ncbi:hypothetical protein HPB51_026624 [Rhipicephalus microplus]|uniref:Neurotransmitter-gated ion-channel ligand-binding domain-containing protein n=1 Tax=Rhipicephalus microplus TaxID=6941 RepID=A0A9J6D2K7_RHIMP|nr:hypothetical protein HPB51_026624 [Rhipicephalus microplus]